MHTHNDTGLGSTHHSIDRHVVCSGVADKGAYTFSSLLANHW